MAMADPDDILRGIVESMNQRKMRAIDFFRKLDASGDGNLSPEEIRLGLQDLGVRLTNRAFATLMARLDEDGSGDVQVREFDRALKAAERQPPAVRKKDVEVQQHRGLTQQDRQDIRQIFCLFKQLCWTGWSGDEGCFVNMDASGGISVEELELLLENVGMQVHPSDVQEMVRSDTDRNGIIDYTEFTERLIQDLQVGHSPEEISTAFRSFARSAPAGFIRVEDLGNALRTFMHREVCDKDVNDLLNMYKDSFVTVPGERARYFNYQDYIDLMTAEDPD